MFKNTLTTTSLVLGLTLASHGMASKAEEGAAVPRLAPAENSGVLLPAQTLETAILSFKGLKPVEALHQLSKTQGCFHKECYIRSEELRNACRAFYVDPEIPKMYYAGQFPADFPQLLRSITIPDYAEATTLLITNHDLKMNANIRSDLTNQISRMLVSMKSLELGVLLTFEGEELHSFQFTYNWRVALENYSDHQMVLNDGSEGGLYISTIKGNAWDKYYISRPISFDNSSQHFSVNLRNDNSIYRSDYNFEQFEADNKYGLPIFVWLWGSLTQRDPIAPGDLHFLGEQGTDLFPYFRIRLALHKISYWFHQNVLLMPTDVNKQTSLAVNPDFFKKHPRVPFTGHAFVDMIVKLNGLTQKGIEAEADDLLWLALATLQMKDSYVLSHGPYQKGRPSAYFIGYMKILYQMFSHIVDHYEHQPLAEDARKEARVMAGTLGVLIPLMEDVGGIQLSNPDYISKLSAQAQMFIKEYLADINSPQLEERTPEEQMVADSLL